MLNTEQKPISVIDALAGGFELILQNPWILIIPVLLDLFLWLGPQVSAKPLFEQLVPALNASIPPDASPDLRQNFDLFTSALKEAGDTVNVLGTTALFGEIATGLPTISGIQPPTTNWARLNLLTVSDGITFFVLLFPLGLAGFVVTCLYLQPIARAVRRETRLETIIPQTITTMLATLGLTILVTILFVGIMVPLSIGATVLSVLNEGLASFVILTGMLLVLWVSLYLTYVLPAIFVSGSNPWQAILNSVSIFRFDFWSAMGLIIIGYLVRMGFSFVWNFFIDNPWGIVFVILANAFLGSGLVAATMVFYADRIKWLDVLRARLQKQRAQIKG